MQDRQFGLQLILGDVGEPRLEPPVAAVVPFVAARLKAVFEVVGRPGRPNPARPRPGRFQQLGHSGDTGLGQRPRQYLNGGPAVVDRAVGSVVQPASGQHVS